MFAYQQEMLFKLPWKAHLGTGDISMVTLPVIRAHGPPGSSCEHLQHGILPAQADWPAHGEDDPLVASGAQRPQGEMPLQSAQIPHLLSVTCSSPTVSPPWQGSSYWWAPRAVLGDLFLLPV